MERIADGVPAWVDQMVLRPRSFVRLTAEVVNRDPEAIERNQVRISVQNFSDTALALRGPGDQQPTPVVRRQEDQQDSARLGRPEVIDIGGRPG